MNELFRKFAHAVSNAAGNAWSFFLTFAIIIVWLSSVPAFVYSDTWQLIINTGTTIVTFLMVFLIQNTQNRDAKAIHLKLDELIRAVKGARTGLIDLEDLTDEQLEQLHKEFMRLQHQNKQEIEDEREPGQERPDPEDSRSSVV